MMQCRQALQAVLFCSMKELRAWLHEGPCNLGDSPSATLRPHNLTVKPGSHSSAASPPPASGQAALAAQDCSEARSFSALYL